VKWVSERLKGPSAQLIPVWGSRNLFSNGTSVQPVFLKALGSEEILSAAESVVFLGEVDEKAFFAIGLSRENGTLADELRRLGEFNDLKAMAPLLEHDAGALLSHARAMVHWHRSTRFCGDCGHPTGIADAGHKRVCTNGNCGRQHFPRTDPAIIVLVARDGRCLLGRQKVWPEGFYSTIAGFVEPGESLEEAVAREVAEETSIRVNEVFYHSSQPWPFPGSIMLGFTAGAGSTAIALRDQELEDARWFTRDDIESALRHGELRLPTRISIAYRLIEDWFDSVGGVPLRGLLDSIGKPQGLGKL
jgi:NAD+ diphosphatase